MSRMTRLGGVGFRAAKAQVEAPQAEGGRLARLTQPGIRGSFVGRGESKRPDTTYIGQVRVMLTFRATIEPLERAATAADIAAVKRKDLKVIGQLIGRANQVQLAGAELKVEVQGKVPVKADDLPMYFNLFIGKTPRGKEYALLQFTN